MNVTRCGWPSGRSISDGQCGALTTTLYIVEVHPLPVHSPTVDDGYQAALPVCNDHDPNRPPSTSGEVS